MCIRFFQRAESLYLQKKTAFFVNIYTKCENILKCLELLKKLPFEDSGIIIKISKDGGALF